MNIETELREDHQIKLHVELDAEPLESAKHQAARKLAKRVKIPGFRPGKAPYHVIVRQIGEGAILEEALDILINDQYPKIIEAADIQPYGPGSLDHVVSLDPPVLDFIVPLAPVVELGDYKSISIPFEPTEVDQEQVEQALEKLREEHIVREPVDRPAAPGDLVFLRVNGRNLNPAEGEDEVIYAARFSSNMIPQDGEDPEVDWPFPGFSRELKGVVVDDEKTLTYTFPADYKDPKLRGLEVEFKVVISNVQSRIVPELNDEFAKTASEFETLEELRASIVTDLAAQVEDEYAQSYDDQVLDAIITDSKILFPPQMLESEQKEMLSSLEHNLSRQRISKEIYYQIRGITEEGLLEEVKPLAEKRLQRSLVLLEIAKAEQIKVDENRFAQETGQAYQMITQGMSRQDAKKLQQSEYLYNVMNSIAADLLSQRTMQYLRATAKGEPFELESEAGEEPLETETEAESEAEVESETEVGTVEDPTQDPPQAEAIQGPAGEAEAIEAEVAESEEETGA